MPVPTPPSKEPHRESFQEKVGQNLGSVRGTCKPHPFLASLLGRLPDPFVTPLADAGGRKWTSVELGLSSNMWSWDFMQESDPVVCSL